ncbi:hypothetical protein [Arthrobacter sp. Br18]|uniref:hypothetical protein n=1 Tax=Arthrobacter sp. Br18 TaxID=1312954 RepID=UPI00047E5CA8|nr:hypothetical protein [Arthrobacter sp. Br18]
MLRGIDAPAGTFSSFLGPRSEDKPAAIPRYRHSKNYVQRIIVDEPERLRPTALELLRDRYMDPPQ